MYKKLGIATVEGVESDPVVSGRCVVKELILHNDDVGAVVVAVGVGATYATMKHISQQDIDGHKSVGIGYSGGLALEPGENLNVDVDPVAKNVNVFVYGFKSIQQP